MLIPFEELWKSRIVVPMVGEVANVTDEDGVVLLTLPLNRGQYSGREFEKYVGPGNWLSVSDGVQVLPTKPARVVVDSEVADRLEMGANPEFKPLRNTDPERHVMRLMERLERKTRALERRNAAAIEDMRRRDRARQEESQRVEESELEQEEGAADETEGSTEE